LAAVLASQQGIVIGYVRGSGFLGPIGVAVAQQINLYVFGVDEAQFAICGEIEISRCIGGRQQGSAAPGLEANKGVSERLEGECIKSDSFPVAAVHGGVFETPAGKRLEIGTWVKNLDIIGVIQAATLTSIGVYL
jgi:hypothetical protein